jgi:diguanylate cyclase (GGDEF)-like protein
MRVTGNKSSNSQLGPRGPGGPPTGSSVPFPTGQKAALSPMSTDTKVRIAFFLALAVLVVLCGFAAASSHELATSAESVNRACQVFTSLAYLEGHVSQAESARRGYLLLGANQFRQDFGAAKFAVAADLESLRLAMRDDPPQQKLLDGIVPASEQRLALVEKSFNLPRDDNWAAEQKSILFASRTAADEFHSLLDRIRMNEQARMVEREDKMRSLTQSTMLLVGFGGSVAIAFLILAAVAAGRDVARRKQVEAALERHAGELRGSNAELQRREHEMIEFSRMTDLLLSSTAPEVAYRVFAEYGPRLFPNDAGRLFVMRKTRNVVEPVAEWGEMPDDPFPVEECWALQRGHVHAIDETGSPLSCQHLGGRIVRYSLCVPILAQGEPLGLFHLEQNEGIAVRLEEAQIERRQRLAVTAAEQIGLALNNLKLQETLRALATRDPVTNLYNRRYMEESLGRELYRVARRNMPLAVILLDIDRFKTFNDQYGHQSGDEVLRSLAEFLSTHIRGEDIACRYGGEEFALILPEASLDVARQRAEQLREGVKALVVKGQGGQVLPPITLSLGISAYPVHAETPQALLRAADVALYRAKRDGRDRAVAYGGADSAAQPGELVPV